MEDCAVCVYSNMTWSEFQLTGTFTAFLSHIRDHTQGFAGSAGKDIKKGLNIPFKAGGICLF